MYASKIVWLDSLITNVDRTARNTNMLYWNKELWLIDHGASLYFHYNWDATPQQLAIKPFTAIKNHVLLQHATLLDVVDVDNQALLTEQVVQDIIAMIPDEWLIPNSPFDTVGAHRQAYLQYLLMRIKNSDKFINEAKHARQETV